MMLKLVTEIFSPEAQLSPEDAELGRWASAVRDDDWVRLHQMGHDLQLEPEALFANIAEGYCHVLAAGVEPKDDAWEAFRKTLANLRYPLLGQAIAYRIGQTN
jgi:hypothetical protein